MKRTAAKKAPSKIARIQRIYPGPVTPAMLAVAIMVYLRESPYVDSMEGRRGRLFINAVDGSRWEVSVRKVVP